MTTHFIAGISNNITALHIRNLTLDFLDLSKSTWRMLSNMSITDGRIKRVGKDFGKHATVSCLNLSSNGIVEFEDRSLVNLYKLKMLDLSNNNLTEIPSLKKDGNISLDISSRLLTKTLLKNLTNMFLFWYRKQFVMYKCKRHVEIKRSEFC